MQQETSPRKRAVMAYSGTQAWDYSGTHAWVGMHIYTFKTTKKYSLEAHVSRFKFLQGRLENNLLIQKYRNIDVNMRKQMVNLNLACMLGASRIHWTKPPIQGEFFSVHFCQMGFFFLNVDYTIESVQHNAWPLNA